MKKFLLFAFLIMACGAARAEEVTYIEEMQSLGAVAGQGLACEASKYDTFELLARAIMISKAKSDQEQAEGMQAFNEYKASAFVSKIKDGFAGCDAIADVFNRQKIFKAVLYGDGSIKMPDGKIITPRHAYDATLVYQKDPEAREKFIKIYQERNSEIRNDPNFQKALQEKQAEQNM